MKIEQQLESLKVNKQQVSLYLVNGIKLVGKIGDFDQCALLLLSETSNQIVFRSAVATIVPQDKTFLQPNNKEESV